ncbi:E3 ubiquitin-protein ligase GW2-like [Zingiber officinale]|uniref:E3 ubiquitin-protein ligase GW2-like n=1 Tax=Zingiber officinale TaxID=94328 RepID=UPI001C4D932B|nr:E3 ubiquitin-protein ligase GW2-like [Zingiber officinale]
MILVILVFLYTIQISQDNNFGSSQSSCSTLANMRFPHARQNRDNDFDLDLESIMIMEAIWLSIQEQSSKGHLGTTTSFLPGPSMLVRPCSSHGATIVKLSPSGGLACAAAALAEHQHMNGDSSSHMDLHVKDAAAVHLENRREMPPEESGVSSTEHWLLVAEGTSYAGSDDTIEAGTSSEGMNTGSGRIVPEIFEEQMMLVMAVTC